MCVCLSFLENAWKAKHTFLRNECKFLFEEKRPQDPNLKLCILEIVTRRRMIAILKVLFLFHYPFFWCFCSILFSIFQLSTIPQRFRSARFFHLSWMSSLEPADELCWNHFQNEKSSFVAPGPNAGNLMMIYIGPFWWCVRVRLCVCVCLRFALESALKTLNGSNDVYWLLDGNLNTGCELHTEWAMDWCTSSGLRLSAGKLDRIPSWRSFISGFRVCKRCLTSMQTTTLN